MRHLTFCLIVVFLAGLLHLEGAPARAQGTPLGEVERDPASGGLDLLLTLPGDEVVVRYTPGALDRAARLQTRLVELQEAFGKWSKLRSRFQVYALSPEEWGQQELALPYGFPVRVADMAVATPAWGQGESVALWRQLVGSGLLPAGDGFSVRGTADENAVVLLADAFVQLEFCRMQVEREGLAGGAERAWVSEIAAHVLLESFSRSDKAPPPVDLPALLQRIGGTLESRGLVSHRDLESYRPDVDLETWLWFQARFAAAAQSIWQVDQKSAARKLLKLRRRKGGPLTFGDLAQEWPVLRSWRQSWWSPAQQTGGNG